MALGTWRDFYQHDWQALYAPLLAPLLFLLYRALTGERRGGAAPAAARFVDRYAILFAVETILDPIATGPLTRALGLSDTAGGTALLIVFVLLGDFRVFLLLFGVAALAAGGSWRTEVGRAAAWTLIVPIAACGTYGLLEALADLPANSIWLIYELGFLAMALALRGRWAPRYEPRGFLAAAHTYAAVYYALWATADVLILVLGLDAGWALRALPNQLYYGLWIPFVFARFFAARYHSTSASAHASR